MADRQNGKKPLDFSGFRRCSDRAPIGGASEPFGTAPGRSTVPVIAITAVAVVPVGVAVHAHFALEPVVAPAFPAPKPGQNGEKPLDFSGFRRCSDRAPMEGARQSRSGPPRAGPPSRSSRLRP